MARKRKSNRKKSNPRDGVICEQCGELSYSKFCLECGSSCTDPDDDSFYDEDEPEAFGLADDAEINLAKHGISSAGLGDLFQDDE